MENNIENNTVETSYEFNSYGITFPDISDIGISVYGDDWYKNIQMILQAPMENNEELRHFSKKAYNISGIISSAIDKMVALPCLDKVVTSKNKDSKSRKKNEQLMNDVLETIKHKELVRDCLHRDFIEGIAVNYFETTNRKINDKCKTLDDYTVNVITELNEHSKLKTNVSIIPLNPDWCKIVGRKNNRYVVAFNLEYFNQLSVSKERVLKSFPKEIRQAYSKWVKDKSSNNWVILNQNKVMVHKIKSAINEVWGRPIITGALLDEFFKTELQSAKRNAIKETKNQIFYETFPEGKDKGLCALTKEQQQVQHNTIKDAIQSKNNRNAISFFSAAAGTKLDSLKCDVAILDEDIEPKINEDIATDLGFAIGLLNGSSGSYSSQQNNIEIVFSEIYRYVSEIATELNYVINKNVIKDEENPVEVYYLPTTLVNRKNFVSNMKDLYTNAGGSKAMYIASTGVDVGIYKTLMDIEREEDWDSKYPPHTTSFTLSGKSSNDTSTGGRPAEDNPTNDSTIQGKTNGSNSQPRNSQ